MEAGGLFSKRDSVDRYAAPFDSARVNAGRWIYIGRFTARGREGTAALLAGALLRGGKLVGEGQNGAPVVTSSRILVVEDHRGVRKPPVATGSCLGVRTGLATARRRTCAAAATGVRGLGKRVRHGRS